MFQLPIKWNGFQVQIRNSPLVLLERLQGGKTSVVEGIELQAVGIEAKSAALCSLPGSQLRASLSENLHGMFIFPKQ